MKRISAEGLARAARVAEIESQLAESASGSPSKIGGGLVAQTDGPLTLMLNGDIGRDVTSADMALALEDAAGQDIRVEINSPGGAVLEGFALYNLLVDYEGEVTTVANALAGSAASLPFLAGDHRYVPRGGRVMVHKARMIVMAILTADAMRELAAKTGEVLDGIDEDIAAILSDASSLSPAEAMEALASETWFTSTTAQRAGVATGPARGQATAQVSDGMLTALEAMKAPKDWLKRFKTEQPQPACESRSYDKDMADRVARLRVDRIRRDYRRRQDAQL